MEETDKINAQPAGQTNQNDCGCEGNCCLPKKKNPLTKIIFAIILLAAIGIIAVKLFHQPAPASAKEACCPPGSAAGCDTTKNAACDTAKGSSCCPKK